MNRLEKWSSVLVKYKHKDKLVLLLIILISIAFRTYGLNWDQDSNLHPDERFMVLTAVTIEWPESFSEYLDPQTSALSPYNKDYKAYVYGTMPLFMGKALATASDTEAYGNFHITGRLLSSTFDVGTTILMYFIVKSLINKKFGLIAAGLYTLTVYAIQQSHFFTVEVYLVFWLTLTFKLLLDFMKKDQDLAIFWSTFIGASLGLAVTSKLSGALFAVIIALVFIKKFIDIYNKEGLIKAFTKNLQYGVLMLLSFYMVVRLVQPYYFENKSWLDLTIQQDFKHALDFQRSAISGEAMFPPQWQWVDKTPYLFPFINVIVWGVGLPIGATAVFGIGYRLKYLLEKGLKGQFKVLYKELFSGISLAVFWILFLFIYGGGSFVKTMRYQFPIFPFLIIAATYMLYVISKSSKKVFKYMLVTIIGLSTLYALAFVNIYSKDTTRVAASKWIYANVPEDSVIANEHWDDPIPLLIPPEDLALEGLTQIHYDSIMMEVYNEDNEQKILDLYQDISTTDYIFVTSPRARGGIGRLPEDFLYMVNYYNALEDGSIGYELEAEFTAYPNLLGIEINDSSAEELFWVYDHPPVRIYKKNIDISFEEFKAILVGE